MKPYPDPVTFWLHLVARGALFLWPPLEAKRQVERCARFFPRQTEAAALRTARCLRGGTCLSRSLAVAARLPNARVVLGVDPQHFPLAHAWIELEGAPLLGEQEPRGKVIARL